MKKKKIEREHMHNVKSFPVNFDKKSEFISNEIKELLDKELGKDSYAAFMQIINSPTIGKTEDKKTEVVSFTFTFSPENKAEEDVHVLVGLLLEAVAKDPAIRRAVYSKLSDKFINVLEALIESDDEEESEEVN